MSTPPPSNPNLPRVSAASNLPKQLITEITNLNAEQVDFKGKCNELREKFNKLTPVKLKVQAYKKLSETIYPLWTRAVGNELKRASLEAGFLGLGEITALVTTDDGFIEALEHDFAVQLNQLVNRSALDPGRKQRLSIRAGMFGGISTTQRKTTDNAIPPPPEDQKGDLPVTGQPPAKGLLEGEELRLRTLQARVLLETFRPSSTEDTLKGSNNHLNMEGKKFLAWFGKDFVGDLNNVQVESFSEVEIGLIARLPDDIQGQLNEKLKKRVTDYKNKKPNENNMTALVASFPAVQKLDEKRDDPRPAVTIPPAASANLFAATAVDLPTSTGIRVTSEEPSDPLRARSSSPPGTTTRKAIPGSTSTGVKRASIVTGRNDEKGSLPKSGTFLDLPSAGSAVKTNTIEVKATEVKAEDTSTLFTEDDLPPTYSSLHPKKEPPKYGIPVKRDYVYYHTTETTSDDNNSTFDIARKKYALLNQILSLDVEEKTESTATNDFEFRVKKDISFSKEKAAIAIEDNIELFKEIFNNLKIKKSDQKISIFIKDLLENRIKTGDTLRFLNTLSADETHKIIAFLDILRLEYAEDMFGMYGAHRLQGSSQNSADHLMVKLHKASLNGGKLSAKDQAELGKILATLKPELDKADSNLKQKRYDPFEPAYVIQRIFVNNAIELGGLAFSQLHFEADGDVYRREASAKPATATLTPVSPLANATESQAWQERQIKDVMQAIKTLQEKNGSKPSTTTNTNEEQKLPEQNQTDYLIFELDKNTKIAVKIPPVSEQQQGHFKFEFYETTRDGNPTTNPINAGTGTNLYVKAVHYTTGALLTEMGKSVILRPPFTHMDHKHENEKTIGSGTILKAPERAAPPSHKKPKL